ncbi:MAG TPA: hypothetical protein VH540_21295, partial [Ktedonobacterales bacterium]
RSEAEQIEFRQGKAATSQASLELFYRAIAQQDQEAWALIHQQWSGRLMRWFLQHPMHHLALKEADAESYLTEALSKFWLATTRSDKFQGTFPTLPELLTYLRCCLNSAVLDGVRQAYAHRCEVNENEEAEMLACDEPELSDEAFWKALERALPDQRERLLIFLRYVQGEHPRQIAQRHPQEFPSAKDIYRMERNILERLRRNPALALWKDCV